MPPVIDLHAHVTPVCFKSAIASTGRWHGLTSEAGELDFAGFRVTLTERLAQMDQMGVDMQVLSPTVGFYQYDNDAETTAAVARDCNDEIAEMKQAYPARFAGFATLPMQDIAAAVGEMERAIVKLRLNGVIIGDHVNGRTYDEPEFGPFWAAAERLGAIVFFHQGNALTDTSVGYRITRYHLYNSVGNLSERALTFGALVFGGVVDRYPGLKLLLGHAGGSTAFGISRMDKAAGALEMADGYGDTTVSEFAGYISPLDTVPASGHRMLKAPSAYLSRFYYDCCTYSGPTLRFLIDAVGLEQVVLGTDYPAPMVLKDAVRWVRSLSCLSHEEKEAILSVNSARLLGL
jgi:aminocarboxymuconate-semialdehyde decarboxylase